MRKWMLILLVLAVSTTSCNSDCSKKVDGPGFSDSALTSWFPYNNTETISFSSSTATEVFHLQLTELTAPYQTHQGGYGAGSGSCYATKRLASTELDSSGPKFNITLRSDLIAFNRDPVRSFTISILGTRVYGSDLNENGFNQIVVNEVPAKIDFFSFLQIGGKTFINVEKASLNNKSTDSVIYQLYISKGKGLVAYSIYPSTELFIKQ